jgi:tRNA (cytidine/uridine-2'-O-)-methyltransferase
VFNVVLYQPEIPPNTGNVIRLCANTGAALHLVAPLGFAWSDPLLRRAGLDYHEFASVAHHADFAACRLALSSQRWFAMTTKARASNTFPEFLPGDVFLFGPESRGLPESLLAELGADCWLRLPMRPNQRSLNLSNAVAVTVFEAWRQHGYAGASKAT